MPEFASRVRQAIERGQYGRAAALWNEWSAELARRTRTGIPAGEWERYRATYQWGRSVLLAARAHLLERINTAHAASAYGQRAEWRSGSLLRREA